MNPLGKILENDNPGESDTVFTNNNTYLRGALKIFFLLIFNAEPSVKRVDIGLLLKLVFCRLMMMMIKELPPSFLIKS